MKHTYKITGMTCNGCKSSVENNLNQLELVTEAIANVEANEVTVTMKSYISTQVLQLALPDKYKLTDIQHESVSQDGMAEIYAQSKLQQLKPLLIILLYIGVASNMMHYKSWDIGAVMLDFMGLFYIVFSFFKLLDLKGFPDSFSMYDPLAKKVKIYGWIYPFIETALGVALLMRFQVDIALIVTIVILGITTIGVTKTLLDKKSIRCACLGTALKLPMTEATFIENAIMIVMAIMMLIY